MPDVRISPRTSALLLQDLQNDIIKSNRPVLPMGSQQLIANCQKLLLKARQVGMPVIYVQVIRRRDLKDAPRPPLGAAAAPAGGPALTEGTEGAKVQRGTRTSVPTAVPCTDAGASGTGVPSIPSVPSRCIITSQNHGFAVSEELPKGWAVWFRNANDGTVEGIAHASGRFFAIQFHPEASPGPEDANYLFDEFVSILQK